MLNFTYELARIIECLDLIFDEINFNYFVNAKAKKCKMNIFPKYGSQKERLTYSLKNILNCESTERHTSDNRYFEMVKVLYCDYELQISIYEPQKQAFKTTIYEPAKTKYAVIG